MGKVTDRGSIRPDDPIFKRGLHSSSPGLGQVWIRLPDRSPTPSAGPPDPAPASGKTQPAKDDNRRKAAP
jgi:hypothetical protein